MATAAARIPTIGDNRRPLVSAAALAAEFPHLEQEVAQFEKLVADSPPVLEDDEDLAAVDALVPKLRKAAKGYSDTRDDNKRHYLDACDVVQKFFKSYETRTLALKAQLESRSTSYLNRKAAAEAARLAADETRLREEAARKEAAAAAAAKTGDAAAASITAAQAVDIADKADDVAAAATVKPAALAFTRTPTGTAGLVDNWEFEIVDFEKIDLNALRSHMTRADIEKAIGKAVRAGKRELAGVKIENRPKSQHRG